MNETPTPQTNESPEQTGITPPEGYRLLTHGEIIKSGDLYWRGAEHSWHETRHKGKGTKWNPVGYWPMARRVPEPQSSTNDSPKASTSGEA